LHSKTQKDNFDLGAKLLSEKMSDINIEASFSDGEFAPKHIARRVGFLRCRHLSKQVVATPVATKFFDSLDIRNNSNLFMFLNATRYKAAFALLFFCLVQGAVTGTESKPEIRQDEPGFWESFSNFFLPHAEKRRILLRRHTRYFLVTVEEDSGGARHLVFNPVKGSQGIWNPKQPDEIISNYCKYMTLFMTMIERPPERVLFIGLGVGIIPRFVGKHFPEATIDVVEIDPDIPEIAERYFAYAKSAGTNIIIKDGRDFINRNGEKYDLIFVDAYTTHNIPFQLTTQEFYRKVRKALKPHGIVSVNIANLGKAQFIASELKTIKSVFPQLEVYVCPSQSNYMPFAAPEWKSARAAWKKKAEKIDTDLKFSYKMKDIMATRMKKTELDEMIKDAIILTDDYAPVETMK
jgi:spermidine synthase